jgi:plastocyanin
MRRFLVISFAISALLVLPTVPALASGGGGCGAELTEAAGTSVDISEYCFVPTVLYVSPGEEITWTNQDPTRHDVLGSAAAWGSFESLRQGATATHSFDRPGVYPYVCTWHPGMSGAVVVGDGGLDRLDIAPVSLVRASGEAHPSDEDDRSAIGLAALGLSVGLALMFVVGMVSRRGRGSTGS